MNCLFAFSYVFLASITWTDRLPPRVRKTLESERPKTSQVEWTLSWNGGYDNGLVERYVTRTTDDTVWESNLGDENGLHSSDVEPPPKDSSEEELRKYRIRKEKNAGTRNLLVLDDQVWHLPQAEHPDVGCIAPVKEAAKSVPLPINLPAIGLAPCMLSERDANPFRLPIPIFEGLPSAVFSEGSQNGLPTVTAEWESGRYRLTWAFDDRRGGKPTRASLFQNDEPVFFSETDYEQIGERWIPESVRYYRGDSTTPYKMIDVQRATFDEPWHMQEVTPTDIGALYGSQFSGPDGYKMWTGAELIPDKEFWELVELYGVLPDPQILEMHAETIGQTVEQYMQFLRDKSTRVREAYKRKHDEEPWLVTKSPKEKDEWDVYVEEFLVKHKLPAPGVQRANEIRDQSKKLRDAYRRKNESKLREAKKEGDPRKIAEYEGIEKRIFDNVLVRELNKLVQVEKDSPKKEP